jgi:hypothetical protein
MLPSGTIFLKSWRENPGVGNDIFKIFSTRRGQVCAQQHMKSFDHSRGRLDGGPMVAVEKALAPKPSLSSLTTLDERSHMIGARVASS